ncbi:MAG TPA: Gfo/Idh/MocA family oxidoreductase [Ferruginibacter sp.]|nr:Gfo/Idh/MocA family oxidoreductase [Ferruginibacter sp.]HMP19660.1 Gfo/Idh/MocA family oxidoreductase [Ferruginibacter sp.]
MSKIKLGVIGMSEGNGHPYSWSAIFNGYDAVAMKDCPFPVIPEYLSKQKFPEDSLAHLGTVTHVWCQDKAMAAHIAAAAKIPNVSESLQVMAGEVDAVLLARDDAENHYEMALPFLKVGLPVFIDKPLALSVADAHKIWAAQQYPNQVFSCSALRYARELLLTDTEKQNIGDIQLVEGSVMKKWETYGIHILEPLVAQLPQRGQLTAVKSMGSSYQKQVLVQWENVSGYFKTTGNTPCPLEVKFFGTRGNISKTFFDSFNAFKNSLAEFIQVIHHPEKNIPQLETLELVNILERGLA